MDFQLVLQRLISDFETRRIRYATIGGFALGALGAARATRDLDFLVRRDDLKQANESLTHLGYQRIYFTDDVSQYRHDADAWGGVDLIHAFRPLALKIVDRAQPRPLSQATMSMRVARPEDIIGLKIQAFWSNPLRRTHEAADIEALASIYGARLNWTDIQEYYELFGLGREFTDLRARYDHA